MSTKDSKQNEAFFHLSDNFSSAYFGKLPNEIDGAKNPATDAKLISNFIDLITNPDKRDLRSDAFEVIRKANAGQFLVDLIANKEFEKVKKDLVMACWECGLDFSAHLIFFCHLVINCEYPIALEAITVIDEMHDLTDISSINEALKLLDPKSLNIEKQHLTKETVERLQNLADQDHR